MEGHCWEFISAQAGVLMFNLELYDKWAVQIIKTSFYDAPGLGEVSGLCVAKSSLYIILLFFFNRSMSTTNSTF